MGLQHSHLSSGDSVFDDDFLDEYDKDSSSDAPNCVQSSFMLFCPPNLQKRNNRHNSNDLLGTPMSTPPMTKRKRQQLLQEAKTNPTFLPQYEGLEKETEAFLPPTISDQQYEEDVQIHEGPDSERAMLRKYELLEVLGVGSTSTCHRCRSRLTGVEFACKVIDKTVIAARFHGMMEQFQTEISALQQLRNHPHIIHLYDVYITDDKVWMVMELMEGGELFDYVVQKGTLTEEEASACVRMVTSALVYMHSKHIIHRDLKPENLLLKHKPTAAALAATSPSTGAPEGSSLQVKIIDFGLSKCLATSRRSPADDSFMASTFLGTRGYLAPELLQRQDYSKKVDTWALGVIVFVLLCGCLPFGDDTAPLPPSSSSSSPSPTLLDKKFQLRFPRWAHHVSASAKDLLHHLLDTDPRRRYTAEQALQHPWITGDAASPSKLLESPKQIKLAQQQQEQQQEQRQHALQQRRRQRQQQNHHHHSHHRRQSSRDSYHEVMEAVMGSENLTSSTTMNYQHNGNVPESVQRTIVPARTLVRKTSI